MAEEATLGMDRPSRQYLQSLCDGCIALNLLCLDYLNVGRTDRDGGKAAEASRIVCYGSSLAEPAQSGLR
jgi:hypothetical protein